MASGLGLIVTIIALEHDVSAVESTLPHKRNPVESQAFQSIMKRMSSVQLNVGNIINDCNLGKVSEAVAAEAAFDASHI